MELIRGKQSKATKCLLYGPEGIGKSTFASHFPSPVFIDTEGSTVRMDVARTPKPTSWMMIMEQVTYFIKHPNEIGTLVIDTADWAEKICIEQLCASKQVKGIEDFGYGRGYVYLAEEFGRLLNALNELIELGVNIVLTAHAQMRKFEQPDETGSYDRWELKLQKKTAPLVKEWADMVLFANYKTYVVNVDNQGAAKRKNKAQGGKRVMYTTHHPCWDAKNRHDLAEELPFEYSAIAHCIPVRGSSVTPSVTPVQTKIETAPTVAPLSPPATTAPPVAPSTIDPPANDLADVPKPLADLMKQNGVTIQEIQQAVASRGYYPKDTPIENYEPSFVTGVLVAAWPQVYGMIQNIRGGIAHG
jgi:GTPase SAR1 family protein